MTNDAENTSKSILDTIKNSPHVNEFIAKIHTSKETLLWSALLGSLGFLAGFFFKHYYRYLAISLIFIGILVGLHYANILSITINYDTITRLFGVSTSVTHDQLLTMLCLWIKTNMFIAITIAIGFLLGICAS